MTNNSEYCEDHAPPPQEVIASRAVMKVEYGSGKNSFEDYQKDMAKKNIKTLATTAKNPDHHVKHAAPPWPGPALQDSGPYKDSVNPSVS